MGKITGMSQLRCTESKSDITNATEQKGPNPPIQIAVNSNTVNTVRAYWNGPLEHPAVKKLSMPRPPTPRPNDLSQQQPIPQPQAVAPVQQQQPIQPQPQAVAPAQQQQPIPQPQAVALAQQQQSIQPQMLASSSQTHPRPQVPKFFPSNPLNRVPVGKRDKP